MGLFAEQYRDISRFGLFLAMILCDSATGTSGASSMRISMRRERFLVFENPTTARDRAEELRWGCHLALLELAGSTIRDGATHEFSHGLADW
jgi:hypothetical protein